MRYPLSPNPVWWALQGEGHLRGFQMAFIRLGGCSVGCDGCDTDYRVTSRADSKELASRAMSVVPNGVRSPWVWITGGEPSDHDLRPLLGDLKDAGFSTAVASSGKSRIIPPVDWLSVSPHGASFQQNYGNEIKVCEGLNGLDLHSWHEANPDSSNDFMYRYVQPLWIGDADAGSEDRASIARCMEFLKTHPRWALSRQDHKHWGVT